VRDGVGAWVPQGVGGRGTQGETGMGRRNHAVRGGNKGVKGGALALAGEGDGEFTSVTSVTSVRGGGLLGVGVGVGAGVRRSFLSFF